MKPSKDHSRCLSISFPSIQPMRRVWRFSSDFLISFAKHLRDRRIAHESQFVLLLLIDFLPANILALWSTLGLRPSSQVMSASTSSDGSVRSRAGGIIDGPCNAPCLGFLLSFPFPIPAPGGIAYDGNLDSADDIAASYHSLRIRI
jgi:hypothetical protein